MCFLGGYSVGWLGNGGEKEAGGILLWHSRMDFSCLPLPLSQKPQIFQKINSGEGRGRGRERGGENGARDGGKKPPPMISPPPSSQKKEGGEIPNISNLFI